MRNEIQSLETALWIHVPKTLSENPRSVLQYLACSYDEGYNVEIKGLAHYLLCNGMESPSIYEVDANFNTPEQDLMYLFPKILDELQIPKIDPKLIRYFQIKVLLTDAAKRGVDLVHFILRNEYLINDYNLGDLPPLAFWASIYQIEDYDPPYPDWAQKIADDIRARAQHVIDTPIEDLYLESVQDPNC